MQSKFLFVLSLSLLALVVSCQKENDLFDELSHEDEVAAEGMEETHEMATAYNDSLIWCSITGNYCSQTQLKHYDSLYHHYDEEYEMHHRNYSHNNRDDDHHHTNMNEHHHGRGGGHIEEEGDEHHGHSQESHLEMNELRHTHLEYHPE